MKNKPDQVKMDNLSYEEAIKKLEEIVHRLEDAEIPLEESLSSFQEGLALSRYCRDKLAEIEYKVEYMLKEEQQSLTDSDCAAEKTENESDQ
ncbi:MAG: exodeoxyribonuclease VII small subunit [Bacillota bacterium]|nr:exodeoxyribonuclease VII small subunit [Bacillota bacterium]